MNIPDKIISIIRNTKDTNVVITNNTDLRKKLELDSFDLLMVMNEIDDEYSISLDEEDFQKVNTPLEISSLLKNKYGIHEN